MTDKGRLVKRQHPLGSQKDIQERKRIVGKLFSLYPSGARTPAAMSMEAYLETTKEVPTYWMSAALANIVKDPDVEFLPKPGRVIEEAARLIRRAWRRAQNKRPDGYNPYSETENSLDVDRFLRIGRHSVTPLVGERGELVESPAPGLLPEGEKVKQIEQTTDADGELVEVDWDQIAKKASKGFKSVTKGPPKRRS